MKSSKFVMLFFAANLVLVSCKKDKETIKIKPEPDAQTITQVEDNNDLKTEGDQANTDVTDALENFKTINGRVAVTNAKKIICGCSIDSVGAKTIRLVYDGETPCGSPSKKRSGTITFQLINGPQWKIRGARVKITMANYKVTRLSDQKSWTFNGEKFLRNVRGHDNWQGYLAGSDSLLYSERGNNINVVMSGGATHTYNVARTTSWKLVNYSNRNVIQFSAIGDTTINGLANVDTWGTNRFGTGFTNNYLIRLNSDNFCWFWRPKSGKIEHKSNGNSVTLTFGVNESGAEDTRECAYGWKINWIAAGGQTGEKIVSY